jgi:hypothetical protein
MSELRSVDCDLEMLLMCLYKAVFLRNKIGSRCDVL